MRISLNNDWTLTFDTIHVTICRSSVLGVFMNSVLRGHRGRYGWFCTFDEGYSQSYTSDRSNESSLTPYQRKVIINSSCLPSCTIAFEVSRLDSPAKTYLTLAWV